MTARLSFAVVREDPELERSVIERDLTDPRAALVVASGGCTALSLIGAMPSLEVHAFDINPTQLAHVRAKFEAVQAGSDRLNVHDDDPRGLNQSGEFERLFRMLRASLAALVASPAEIERFFHCRDAGERQAIARRWARSPYWSPVFESVFHDAMLEAMFGPSATQHAEKGSYPRYFQRVFERGLSHERAAENYFLHHVLLGRYLAHALPAYLRRPARTLPTLLLGSLQDVPQLSRFDLLSLSNILDWSDDAQTAAWAEALRAGAKNGSAILVRQLNNHRDLGPALGDDFALDRARSEALFAMDRSLFYERVSLFRRVRGGPA